jgi:hypothetical protein
MPFETAERPCRWRVGPAGRRFSPGIYSKIRVAIPSCNTVKWLFLSGGPSDRSSSLGWKKKPPQKVSIRARLL